MGRSQETDETLFKAIDGPVLVAFGNWLADSLDASELSNEQVLLLSTLLGRGMDVLWHHFPHVLVPMVERVLAQYDDEDEDHDKDD